MTETEKDPMAPRTLREAEREAILYAIRYLGQMQGAAKALGCSRSALYAMVRRHGIAFFPGTPGAVVELDAEGKGPCRGACGALTVGASECPACYTKRRASKAPTA